MIKYNNNTINDWDYGTSNIIKVYRNNNVCYYKVVSSPAPEPQYRTISGETYCSGQTGYDKYVDVYSQVSYDGGSTWETTATTPTLVEADSPDCGYVKNYLRFIAKGNGTFTFTPKTDAASGNVISYSLDSGSTWTSANTTSTVQNGDVVFIKGENFGISSNAGIGTFSSTANFDVEGNAMSLLYGDNFENQTSLSGKDYAFMNLFSGCTTIINADKMELPATTLSNYCYCNMFNRAFNLVKAPSELPATTLGDACYMNMFYNCGAMTTVMDELPATTLAASAYSQMFTACSGFTTTPILPAAVITTYGYYRMFYNAKKVNSITCLALDKTAYNANGSFTYGVASSGTFTKHKDMTSWSRGSNGIPNNWTVVDYSG